MIGAAASDSRKESRNAWNPWYRVNTSSNHLVVSGKNLKPQVGKNAPMGTQIYIRITKPAASAHRMVSGVLTLLSSMSIRARDALPVRVAAVLRSR